MGIKLESMNFQLLFFTTGFLLLYVGAEWLVKGATILAKKARVSTTLTGLTIVAFGTSAPEFVVSIVSLYRGKEMIAIGNIVGSNICNFTMVLGIAALIRPVTINKTSLVQDIPIVILVSFCFFILSLDSVISSLDGLILFTGCIIYINSNYHKIKKKKNTKNDPTIPLNIYSTKTHGTIIYVITTILFGIIFMTIGSELLVSASIKIMNILGISEKCIGLTVLAVGTSIPELAISVVASIKKQVGITIGNLIGSNLFNILSVIGITTIIHPITIDQGFIKSGLILDYLAMIIVSTFPLFLMNKNKTVSKTKGIILIFLYVSYVITLFART